MYAGFYEEGDRCPSRGCDGLLQYSKVENCSCHINPPCSACVSNSLECEICSWEPDEPEYKDIPVILPTNDGLGLFQREYKPRPLDKSKIDYRIKSHSGSSMIKEGVYPDGTTKEQVREAVNGSFGGRFEYFERGRFKFIAYTD